jgi:inner membrane protease subunit 2
LNPDTSGWDDIVVFDRYAIHSGEPIRTGDIVALRYESLLSMWDVTDISWLFSDPIDSRKMVVKRIVAVAGDAIKTLPPYPDAEVVIPEGHVWVEGETDIVSIWVSPDVELGDEPFRTLDSNKFGPVGRYVLLHLSTLMLLP